MKGTLSTFKVFHTDHGITADQMEFIQSQIPITPAYTLANGALNWSIVIPEVFGPVLCGLHGPRMGDEPVSEGEVERLARGDRNWTDRLVDRPYREVNFVQAIGIYDEDENVYVLFTVYGGPLAPQNPDDPSNKEKEKAVAFWNEHALSSAAV